MPIEPSTVTFYFRHSQTGKKKCVHWSNTWHISNQLITVWYQTIVVNLANRLITKVMIFSNSVSWPDIQPLILNNKQIETVKEYKYLGIVFT